MTAVRQALLMTLIIGGLGGCAAASVQPWDRDLLAQDKMKPIPSAVEYDMEQKVYFSKEAASGGNGVGGGGCGCN